jgi:hypothetical protein
MVPQIFSVNLMDSFMKAATGSDPAATDPINYGLELFYTDGTEKEPKCNQILIPG